MEILYASSEAEIDAASRTVHAAASMAAIKKRVTGDAIPVAQQLQQLW